MRNYFVRYETPQESVMSRLNGSGPTYGMHVWTDTSDAAVASIQRNGIPVLVATVCHEEWTCDHARVPNVPMDEAVQLYDSLLDEGRSPLGAWLVLVRLFARDLVPSLDELAAEHYRLFIDQDAQSHYV